MMCHCNCLPSDLSIPSSKACTSLGNKRLCTKLWATRPLSPFSHTRTFVVAGSGLLSNWNEGCHLRASQEVDATFIPIWVVGSRMMIFPDGRGGVLIGVSSELVRVYSTVRCLFWEQPERGGGEGGGGGVWP